MSVATHSKLRKALNGTDTQVATCMINKRTVKMNGAEGYITTEISQEKGTITVLWTPESSGHEALEIREEEEFILGLSPRIKFYHFSTHLTIPLPYGLIRLLKKLSLRPNS